MVERLHGRAQFTHVRAHGSTLREGRLRVSVAPPDQRIGPGGPALAFALSRRYGTAVQRNLARRRLREIIRSAADRGELPRRWFLVSLTGSGGEPSFAELRGWFDGIIERTGCESSPSGGTHLRGSDR